MPLANVFIIADVNQSHITLSGGLPAAWLPRLGRPRWLAASKKIKNLLHSTHCSLIELRETTPSAGDSVVALISYIKEAAPKPTRDANLTSLIGSTATLTTHVARRFTAVSSHVPLEFGFL